MLHRVSHHAVIRYLDRVLGLPVDAWLVGMEHKPESQRSLHCCERAGLPVDAVRSVIMHPAIARVCAAGFVDVAVRLDGFVYIIQDGNVITVLTHGIYLRTMGSRYGQPRVDKSKKRRKEKRRLLALAEVI